MAAEEKARRSAQLQRADREKPNGHSGGRNSKELQFSIHGPRLGNNGRPTAGHQQLTAFAGFAQGDVAFKDWIFPRKFAFGPSAAATHTAYFGEVLLACKA